MLNFASSISFPQNRIADVFIYTTRLCDICSIDLASSVKCYIDSVQYSEFQECDVRAECGKCWADLSLDFGERNTFQIFSESPRHLCLQIQSIVGEVCHLFSLKGEADCSLGLPSWSPHEVRTLSLRLGSICCRLAALAKVSNHNMGNVIADKFSKNEAKYPAEMVKGSSAKYTQYKNRNKSSLSKNISLQRIFDISGGFALGVILLLCFGRR